MDLYFWGACFLMQSLEFRLERFIISSNHTPEQWSFCLVCRCPRATGAWRFQLGQSCSSSCGNSKGSHPNTEPNNEPGGARQLHGPRTPRTPRARLLLFQRPATPLRFSPFQHFDILPQHDGAKAPGAWHEQRRKSRK